MIMDFLILKDNGFFLVHIVSFRNYFSRQIYIDEMNIYKSAGTNSLQVVFQVYPGKETLKLLKINLFFKKNYYMEFNDVCQ